MIAATVGAAIAIPDFERFDPAIVLRALRRHRATVINCTPSAFYSLVETEGAELLEVDAMEHLDFASAAEAPVSPASRGQ